jgi:Flp pilus assembly protein TadD
MGTAILQRFAVLILSASAILGQTGTDVVSADVLRHPITPKVRQLLLRAMEKIEAGDHETAIHELQETLTKYPDSAAYVHNLLGVEYVKTDRFKDAVSSFEQAVLLLPHDAMTHYNFGLALVCAGDYDRAAQEVQRALELDPRNTEGNTKMRARLNALLEHKRSVN